MGLDATTFLLEIVNFIVLLWLLNHFLFRPVQSAIVARQRRDQEAQKSLDSQRRALTEQQAEIQRARAQFDAEREAAREKLAADITAERARRIESLNAELRDEREKARALAEAREAEDRRRQEALAASRALEFLRRYLARLAGAELEKTIIGLFLADLAAVDPQERQKLQAAPTGDVVNVYTAFAPQEDTKRDVEAALVSLLGPAVRPRWQTDGDLVSGISVHLDGQLLEVSLARSLDAFGPTAKAST